MSKVEPITTSQERLKEMLSALKLSQTDICKRTGIKKSAMSNYVNGRRKPDRDAIFMISDAYKINPAWLLGYDLNMYQSEEFNKLADEISMKVEQLDGDALELIVDFHNFNKDGKNELLRYVKYLKTIKDYRG